ncbi:cell wall-binding repeat-containing protein [Miniphocaeibacter halophilus]|uniref:Cell wall-binding repeat-containing protein n=1 Tax=Miniphocaeibacter halophilus TaxID=2931922 RepID=A0AC61MP75_9FIRM|nr:cell wall-binding repeat-containing protein [Miniphocaeibacter halophilus]QQK07202.1 cell wall-binding repeat-containing protein [Miniphocaeibacter halophilus]
MKRRIFVILSILIFSLLFNITYAKTNGQEETGETTKEIVDEGEWRTSNWKYYNNKEIVFGGGSFSTVEEAPWNNGTLDKDDIEIITFKAKVKAPIDMSYLFYGFNNLKEINNLNNFDITKTTNMSHLFDGVKIKEIDISRWDNAKEIKNTSYMFNNIKNIKKLDVSGFNTATVTDMSYMFANSNFEEIDLSKNSVLGVKNMNNIFLNTPYLNKLTLGLNFRFKGNTGLAKGTTPYTDSWKGLKTGVYYKSTEEFTKNYDGNNFDTYYRIIKKYKVDFDNNFNEIINTQEVEHGNKLKKLENPKKEGYKFTYWSIDKEGIKEFDFEKPITNNVTLYANWKKEVSIVYDGNGNTGGVVPIDESKYEEGSKVTLKRNEGNLEKTGYTFAGWSLEADNDESKVITEIASIEEDTTVYAVWKEVPKYRVSYDANADDIVLGTVPIDNREYEKGETVDVFGNAGNLARKDYKFDGWAKDPLGNDTIEDTFIITKDTILYAQWVLDRSVIDSEKPINPTGTIKEITLIGGRSTLTENIESQLMDFVQYRLAGKDRYGTSADVAKEYKKSSIVLLASGEKYTDELTATVLANKLDAPIMLTRKDAIPAEVKAEINRLGATKVILVGGNNSISEKVEKELSAYTVERIGGPDRYDTAILVGDRVRGLTGSKTDGVLVDGTNFPDAIAMTSMAVEENMPILLTRPGQLPESTAKTIKDWNLSKVTIGGGVNSVSDTVANEVKKFATVDRIAGADRYETSVLVAEQVYVKPKHAVIASGEVFPDAIVGAPYAAKNGYPMVLSRGNNVSEVVKDYIFSNR